MLLMEKGNGGLNKNSEIPLESKREGTEDPNESIVMDLISTHHFSWLSSNIWKYCNVETKNSLLVSITLLRFSVICNLF